MAIRRFREHVADQNWFAVLVDISVVVLGVFLGLQANNWNNDRLERATAADFRSEIIDNLRANEISIGDQIAYYRQVNRHAEAVLGLLGDPAAKLGEPFIVDAYQATQIRQRQLTGAAYEEMKSVGLGRLIAGPKARALLSSYYAQLPQINDPTLAITAYRDRVRSAIPFSVQRRIRQRCEMLIDLPHGVVGSALVNDCQLGLSRAEIDRTSARLRTLPSIEFDLTRRIVDVDARIAALQALGDRARTVRQSLEALQA